ncbi:MAG: hypothetical protein K2H72_07360 [Muribaculaceae bacterium]|nr:hypothetical protein [Muribaculaceae bacterium]
MERWKAAVIAAVVALGANGEYTLKTNQGILPEGVKTENLNKQKPDERVYKRGWTEDGWSVGDYGIVKNAVICPSFMAEGVNCEAALTLPAITIEAGEWLLWQSRAAYPLRHERHTAEIRRAGEEEWTVIFDATDTGGVWNQRMADLSSYAGEKCEIRIVCRSTEGYLLLLNAVKIAKPTGMAFECVNDTPKFFTPEDCEEGCASIDFSITNTGSTAKGAKAAILVGSERVTESESEPEWKTGETRRFSLKLPIDLNERTEYSIAILTDEGGILNTNESFAFMTSKRRHLLVDKGTGMWCNNCPVGSLEMEELEREYGESLISIETHNGDPLANDTYFSWLGYYAIPRMELNRITATAGETPKNFKSRICMPTEMGIDITELTVNGDGTLSITAEVSTSDLFSDSDRTFAIGYVLTKDISGDEDAHYYQSNSCSIATYLQYYYLPSNIFYKLCSFPNSSLPSPIATTKTDPAFTGIEGSLPEKLEAGSCYTAKWDVPLPTGYTDFSGMRVAAYILDTGNRNIKNSTAAYIDGYSGVKSVITDGSYPADGYIYFIDGRVAGQTTEGLAPGIYIANGKKIKL